LRAHAWNNIHSSMPTMTRFSVSDMNPSLCRTAYAKVAAADWPLKQNHAMKRGPFPFGL